MPGPLSRLLSLCSLRSRALIWHREVLSLNNKVSAQNALKPLSTWESWILYHEKTMQIHSPPRRSDHVGHDSFAVFKVVKQKPGPLVSGFLYFIKAVNVLQKQCFIGLMQNVTREANNGFDCSWHTAKANAKAIHTVIVTVFVSDRGWIVKWIRPHPETFTTRLRHDSSHHWCAPKVIFSVYF